MVVKEKKETSFVDFCIDNKVVKYGNSYGTSSDYNPLFIKDGEFVTYTKDELINLWEENCK